MSLLSIGYPVLSIGSNRIGYPVQWIPVIQAKKAMNKTNYENKLYIKVGKTKTTKRMSGKDLLSNLVYSGL